MSTIAASHAIRASSPPRPVAGGVGPVALTFIGLHAPLAVLMGRSVAVSTVHALLTLAIGLVLVVAGRQSHRLVYLAAYITGAEVLWRMSGARVNWEFGKYAIAFLFLAALIRSGKIRPPRAIVLYFLLLLPSVLLTVSNANGEDARAEISYNLSGPFALMVSVWFFSTVRLSRADVARTSIALLAPIVGIAANAAYGIRTASVLTFGRGSNFQTSGGFGPNQVSAILGLGALLAVLIVFLRLGGGTVRVAMGILAIGLAAQSALTFSRSGLIILALCLLGVLAPFAKNPKTLVGLLFAGAALIGVAYYLVLPRLDRMTGGALVDRFESRSLTGRDQLAKIDLLIFLQHPIIGVGPGEARALRSQMGRGGLAHTEYTRLLAEHGVLGLASLVLMLATGFEAFRSARSARGKAFVIAFLGWSLLYMLVNGMRLVAPSLIFGLACARLSDRRARTAAPAWAAGSPARPGAGVLLPRRRFHG